MFIGEFQVIPRCAVAAVLLHKKRTRRNFIIRGISMARFGEDILSQILSINDIRIKSAIARLRRLPVIAATVCFVSGSSRS
jgi:hypothetical protein